MKVVRLESVPAGAAVTCEDADGARSGRTPMDVRVPSGSTVVAKVRAAGFYPATVRVGDAEARQVVRLKPIEIEIP